MGALTQARRWLTLGPWLVVVGAYALAFHGAPRFTGDLDVLIRPTVDHAERLLRALDACGFPATGLTPEQIADRRRRLEVGVPPVQIRVMSTISGVEWDEVWTDRSEGRLGSHPVPFIGQQTYLRNKRAAGRPKDLADIDALRAARTSGDERSRS